MRRITSSAVNKYMFACILSIAILLISMFLLILKLNNTFASVIIMLLFYFAGTAIIKSLANKYIFSVLFKEKNAVKFGAIIKNSKFLIPLPYQQLLASYFSGDYQTSVNICAKQLAKKSTAQSKYFYFFILACSYFELHDIDKLRAVYDRYEYYLSKEKNQINIKKPYSIMQFFKYYLESDFTSCKNYCETLVSNSITNINHKTNLFVIQNNFYYAIACFKLNDKEKAYELLKSIIEVAPNLNYAKLSEEIINNDGLLEKNGSYVEILPDTNYPIQNEKKIKILRISKIILFVICFLALVGMQHFSYDAKVKSAIMMQYDDYGLVEYFNVEKNGDLVAVICIIENELNTYDVKSVVTADNGKTFSLVTCANNIKPNQYYSARNPANGYYIGFRLYDNKDDVPEDVYKTVPLKNTHGTKYFAVVYIE